MHVRVQREPFDVAAELAAHGPSGAEAGAEVHFVGNVRDLNAGNAVEVMELEHYPGMTERELARVAEEAAEHWAVLDSLVIHRYGPLHPGDRIVLVSVWAAHRADAFDACRYIIDRLKTTAPFWKKEALPGGHHRWVAPAAGESEPGPAQNE